MFNSIWFDSLNKPILQPPAWIFSPIWIILYATLIIALIIYSRKISKKSKLVGYILFAVHMSFNILWSPVFFLFHQIEIALFIILIIDITAFFLIKKIFYISKIAGTILIPYFIWIIFATYLNIQFCILN